MELLCIWRLGEACSSIAGVPGHPLIAVGTEVRPERCIACSRPLLFLKIEVLCQAVSGHCTRHVHLSGPFIGHSACSVYLEAKNNG